MATLSGKRRSISSESFTLKYKAKPSLIKRVCETLSLFYVFFIKSHLTILRRWVYFLGTCTAVIVVFLIAVLFSRWRFPYTEEQATHKLSRIRMSGKWIVPSFLLENDHILIGYAPNIPINEAIMEEVERIIVKRYIVRPIKDIQMVPFHSEYSMSEFLRNQPGILSYAFALHMADDSNTRLGTALTIISYLQGNECWPPNTLFCAGEVFISKVIMEAFINAHTGRESNISISITPISSSTKQKDPILTKKGVEDLKNAYVFCMGIMVWFTVFQMASERQSGIHVTLQRMGISESLNFAGAMAALVPFLTLLLVAEDGILSTPMGSNTAIAVNSDKGLILIFDILKAFSIFSYCILCSVIFFAARQCVMFALFLMAVSTYLYRYWRPPSPLKECLAFLAMACRITFKSQLLMERHANGLQWTNLELMHTETFKIMTPSMVLHYLVASVPLFLSLAAVIVYMRSSATPFWIQGIRWPCSRERKPLEFHHTTSQSNFEIPSAALKPCIVMENVYTEGVVSLKDVNWTVFEDEISVAIGLENSGRKAVCSVIYGETRPSYGKVEVFGLDCGRDSARVKRNCSVCLHTPMAMFQCLTVRDNLWIFSKLRYYCQDRKNDNISEMMRATNLDHVMDTKVWMLTKDQQAILNVALAFVGDSKLVILEDPTKNMNVNTKMHIWNLIQLQAQGRSVLVSTMDMEEALLIGDRITIFRHGQIHCSGSVHYLNSFFGTGYYLTIHKQPSARSTDLILLCQRFCPGSVSVKEAPDRLVILLPTADQANTSPHELFEYFEKYHSKLGINHFDVQGTTLENAFINLTRLETSGHRHTEGNTTTPKSKPKREKESSSDKTEPSGKDDTDSDNKEPHVISDLRAGSISYMEPAPEEIDTKPLPRKRGFALCFSRLMAVMQSRLLTSCRKVHQDLFQAALIVLLVIYYHHPAVNEDQLTDETVVDHRHTHRKFCPSFAFFRISGGQQTLDTNPNYLRLWKTLLKVHSKENRGECTMHTAFLDDHSENFHDFLLKQTARYGIPDYGVKLRPRIGSDQMKALIYISEFEPGRSMYPALAATMETFLRYRLNDTEGKYSIHVRAVYKPKIFDQSIISMRLGAVSIIIFIIIPYVNIKRRTSGTLLHHLISGASPVSIYIGHLFTDMLHYLFLIIVYFLITQFMTPIFPKHNEAYFMSGLVMLYGVVVLTHIYCLQKLFTNGMIGTGIIVVILFFSAEAAMKQMNIERHPSMLYLVCLLFPASLLPVYLYLFGHEVEVEYYCAVDRSDKCHIYYNQDICCTDMLEPLDWNRNYFVIVGCMHLVIWMFIYFFTAYNLHFRLWRCLISGVTRRDQEQRELYNDKRASIVENHEGGPLAAISHILSSTGDSPSASKLASVKPSEEVAGSSLREYDIQTSHDQYNVVSDSVDPSILSDDLFVQRDKQERQLDELQGLQESCKKSPTTANDQAGLMIENLSKGDILNDISVKVSPGEMFCFVSMDVEVSSEVLCCISGRSKFDKGSIRLDGKPLGAAHVMSDVTIGYLIRDRSLNYVQSLRESLRYFCKLRGVVHVAREVNLVIRLLKLTSIADISPKGLSEGAISRFRIAKAIVGEPDLILLDQPLANLDTAGKILVHNVIHRLRNRGKTVVMTSNRLNDCANLASRVGILVRGHLVLVDCPHVIRDQFANSYSLTTRLNTKERSFVTDILIPSLLQRFPDSEIFVDNLNYLHILLPFRTDSLADIFRLMFSVKKHLKTSDFILRHATLDNVMDALEGRETFKSYRYKRSDLELDCRKK